MKKNKKASVSDLAQIALMAALTAVLAYVIIPLPFSPVPLSAQTLAVMLSGSLLGAKKGSSSQLIYILMGGIGLPVFAGGNAGAGVLVGPTGGYIWGFVAGAFVIGLILKKVHQPGIKSYLLANFIGGIIVVHLFGVIQLTLVTGMTFPQALWLGTIPYLTGDALKVLAASYTALKIKPHLK